MLWREGDQFFLGLYDLLKESLAIVGCCINQADFYIGSNFWLWVFVVVLSLMSGQCYDQASEMSTFTYLFSTLLEETLLVAGSYDECFANAQQGFLPTYVVLFASLAAGVTVEQLCHI